MKIERWDAGLAVRLPAEVVDALGLNEGDNVDLRIDRDGTSYPVVDEATRRAALESMRGAWGALPADYKFDREEANAR